MSATYSNSTDQIQPIAEKLIQKHYPDLDAVDIKIDYLFATAQINDKTGEPTGPAIIVNGYRAYAVTKILSLKDRTMDRGDAEILIDGDLWPTLSWETQIALLDHELMHIECKRTKEGEFMWDDLNRPRLTLKKHDYQVGWFHEIAQRHGRHSIEAKQFHNLLFSDSDTGQIYLPFTNAKAIIGPKAIAVHTGDEVFSTDTTEEGEE